MANIYYNHTSGVPVASSTSSSALVRAEFDLIEDGFDKWPTLAGNAGKALVINAPETAITVTTGTLALAGNFAMTGAFNTTFTQTGNVLITLPAASQTLLGNECIQGHIYGLRLSNNATDPTNDIDIAIGGAASDDNTALNVRFLALTTAMTKRLDATWVAGTGNGGRATNASGGVLSNTTYHVFLILVNGVVDVGFDSSITAGNLVADHGATAWRRIGSIIRDTGAILGFQQVYDYFFLDTPYVSVNTTNPGTSAVTATLRTPANIKTLALLTVMLIDATPTVVKAMLVTSFEQTDSVPVYTADATTDHLYTIGMDANDEIGLINMVVKTNTTPDVRYRLSVSDADITARIHVYGWIDDRNRYATANDI